MFATFSVILVCQEIKGVGSVNFILEIQLQLFSGQ